MASLCGRIVLAAAKRNVTYTPVRFCKSKFFSVPPKYIAQHTSSFRVRVCETDGAIENLTEVRDSGGPCVCVLT